MNKQKKLLLGAHMSIKGGLEKSIEIGESIGCSAIQIFTSSNRQWHSKQLTLKDIDIFKKVKQKYNMSVVVHASYLINLGSENQEIIDKSIKAIEVQLNNCNKLDIPVLILHPGAGTKPADAAIEKIGNNLNKILENNNTNTIIALEIMAGQGSSVGSTFEQLANIKSLIKKPVGFCFDTCHAWASGYNFNTVESYTSMWQKFNKAVGIENLKVIHMNGSKKDLGSHVDRHSDIDEGTMGLEPFRLIMNDPRFINIPKILEIPAKSINDYKRNMSILESLIKN